MTRPRRGRSGDSATFVRWFWQFLPYCAKSLSHELFDLSRSACLLASPPAVQGLNSIDIENSIEYSIEISIEFYRVSHSTSKLNRKVNRTFNRVFNIQLN